MVTKTVEIHVAQKHLAELVAQVVAGVEIILVDGQTPRARLVPIDVPATRMPGLHVGSIITSEDFDQPLPESFWTGAL